MRYNDTIQETATHIDSQCHSISTTHPSWCILSTCNTLIRQRYIQHTPTTNNIPQQSNTTESRTAPNENVTQTI